MINEALDKAKPDNTILSGQVRSGQVRSGHLHAVPISFKAACDYIDTFHRHHVAPQGDKFRVACADDEGTIHGVVTVGRPVSRMIAKDETVLEVTRLCTDGTYNACSFLYSRAARIAEEMGYRKIITYILDSESGSSLKAAGWELESADVGGGSWSRENRPREIVAAQMSLFGEQEKYPIGKKQRWVKHLRGEHKWSQTTD